MMIEDINFIKSLNLKGKTLDIGSLDINGSIKKYCENYIGIDIRKGSNVDILASSHDLPFKSESFDNIVSVGTLEHDKEFWISLNEIRRVLKIGGKFILSIPNYEFKYHAHPKDYWRFSIDSIDLLLEGFKSFSFHKSSIKDNCMRVCGIK